jgi:hypothetical protein
MMAALVNILNRLEVVFERGTGMSTESEPRREIWFKNI